MNFTFQGFRHAAAFVAVFILAFAGASFFLGQAWSWLACLAALVVAYGLTSLRRQGGSEPSSPNS